MIIGGVTLPEQYTPLKYTKPRPELSTAVINTYGGVAIFDWGSILPGKKITLEWRSMTVELFDVLDLVYQAGDVVVWDSGITGQAYNVKITSFDGSLLLDPDNAYMLDITMTMHIISEVVS